MLGLLFLFVVLGIVVGFVKKIPWVDEDWVVGIRLVSILCMVWLIWQALGAPDIPLPHFGNRLRG